MLHCHIKALKKHMSRTEQYCCACPNHFISLYKKKKQVSKIAILLLIRSAVNYAYGLLPRLIVM